MKLTTILVFIIDFSFAHSQTYFNNKKVNTNPLNSEYKNSRKYFYGELNKDEYKNTIVQLEKELKTTIIERKSIFINFEQAASNCSLLKGNNKYLENYHLMRTNISNKISSENNATDFFIYDNNSFLIDYVTKSKKHIHDSGYFSTNIFTLKENFLKPNGKFLICYGTDSFNDA